MKFVHLSIIVILSFLGFVSLALSFGNTAHGIWVPESTHDLLEKSATIFVGNITATKVLQFENQYSYLAEENGTDKNITKNYTLNLDEYTVNVEEYLKNPQNSPKITVRQPTVGIMGELGGLDGFKTGDHVLFYVEKLDGNNTYSPQSFTLPTFCNGKDVLTQERPEGGSEFTVIQNGVKVDYGNFTANKPIKFLSSKDMGTLSGKSYDLEVGITRNSGGNTETVFNKEIHSNSKPCEWVATAEWEFTPQEGNYRMGVITKEGGIITGTSDTGFSVKSDTIHTNQMSPLEQFKSGVKVNEIHCSAGFQLVVKSEDNSPACVKPDTAQKLIERGWAKEIVTNTLSESTTNELEIELANQTYEAGYPVGVNLKNVNQDHGCKIPSITVRDVSDQSLVFGPTPERDYGHDHCADPWHVTFYAGLEKNALVTKPTRFEILATLDNVTYQKEFTAVPSNYSGTDITSESNQILPGFLTFSTCLPIPNAPPNNGTLVKYTGFAVYHRYLAEQGSIGMEIDDYLLNPGQTGSFVMQVHQGQFPSGYNLAGGLDFQSQNLLNVDNDTTWKLNRPTASEAHPGLVVSYTPDIAHVGPQGYATFNVLITAMPNATQGSYWLHLPPGRCGGHLVLLTVGDKPLAQPPDYIGNDFDSNFVVDTAGQLVFELINPSIHTFENCSLNYISNNQTTTIKTFSVIPPGMEYKHIWNATSNQIDKRFLQCTAPPITKIYPNEMIDGLPW